MENTTLISVLILGFFDVGINSNNSFLSNFDSSDEFC